ADAWMNAKFSIGLNWQIQSANNNFLWGLWKNGQVPGPEAFGGGYGHVPYGAPSGGYFPYFGSAPQPTPQSYPTQTVAPPQAAMQPQSYNAMPQNYSYNPYQSVSYQSGSYYPNYYNPTYSPYYGQQVPYYWYQGR